MAVLFGVTLEPCLRRLDWVLRGSVGSLSPAWCGDAIAEVGVVVGLDDGPDATWFFWDSVSGLGACQVEDTNS